MQKTRLKLYIIHQSTDVLDQWFSDNQITTKAQANTIINHMFDSTFVYKNKKKIELITQNLK